MRTRLRPAARLVVGAALLATLGGGGVASAEGATLDDVVAALRTVVDDPSWQTKSRTLERDAFAGITQTIPFDAAALATMKGARSLEAIAPGRDAWYAAYVLEFEGAAGAPALLSAMRTAIEGMASRVPPRSTLEIADGAGVGPGGWRLEATHGREGARSAMQGRAIARDRFAVLLYCHEGPDADAQVEVLRYADAWIADPAAARSLPRPKARPAPHGGPTLRVRVLGPDGKPVPRADVAIGSDYRSYAAEAREGVVEFSRAGGAVQVLVWGARDLDDEPLPMSPSDSVTAGVDEKEVEVRLAAGVEISGKVVDNQRRAVFPARVEATARDWGERVMVLPPPHATAAVAPDGSFRLVGLGQTEYRLRVTRAGRPIAARDAEASGGDSGLEIVVVPSVRARLRVLDPDGAPVPGVAVWARARGAGPQTVIATTGADGAAVLDRLEGGAAYELEIGLPPKRDDLAVTRVEPWSPADGDVRFERGWALRGVVRDAGGRPIPGRVVRRDEGGRGLGETTDAEGAFELRGLPLRPVEIAAFDPEAPLYRPPDARPVPWSKVAPGTASVELLRVEDESKRLRVRVLEPDGKPVPLATLHVLPKGADIERLADVVDGSASFDAPDDAYDLEVRAARTREGELRGLAPLLRRGLAGGAGDVELRLLPGVAVSGTVRGEDGKPVAGAVCTAVSPADVERFGAAADTAARLFNVARNPETLRLPGYSWGTTDAAGSFRLTGLANGRYALLVAPRPPAAAPEPTFVEAPNDHVVVTLPRAVAVQVLDWEGSPVREATLAVARPDPKFDSIPGARAVSTATDADGKAWIRGLDPKGPWVVEVRGPSAREDLIAWRWRRWDPAQSQVRLEHGFVLRGFVVDGDGPASVVSIEARVGGPSGVAKDIGWTELRGRFKIPDVPYGPVSVRARDHLRQGAASDWVEVNPAADGDAPLRLVIR